ncbi:MAG: 1-deoxy-D-xylulose-5-phosphate reductoisomerase [Proteobacteria bacterium]|nr:MAG: 1-deoxy-D-xylulose-5-phosphate reductoisomerase [Pseudomonadota bacterium]
MKQVAVLGATGSIGDSTLAVIRRHPDKLKIHSLTAHRNSDKMIALIAEFAPKRVVITDHKAYKAVLASGIAATTECHYGADALNDAVQDPAIDLVVAGIVGNAGMASVMAAVKAGKTLLLANKESIVTAGSLVMPLAQKTGAKIIPLDSEHNAIYQCLPDSYRIGERPASVAHLTLTASGGPFWNTPAAAFKTITPAQAVAHPQWDMGAKISVDSATLMNKGLEVIEAHWLFSMPVADIRVCIHPQSIIHSMVNYVDGSILAQLGTPDMQIPISYGLGMGQRLANDAALLDITALGQLQFYPANHEKFPNLNLARQAIEMGGTAPAILNAANEVAVAAFLNEEIAFTKISDINDRMLNSFTVEEVESVSQLIEIDQMIHQQTTKLIKSLG